jgi:hypothetical protein
MGFSRSQPLDLADAEHESLSAQLWANARRALIGTAVEYLRKHREQAAKINSKTEFLGSKD